MKKLLYTILIIILNSQYCFSKNNIDSLFKIFKNNTLIDSVRIGSVKKIMKYYDSSYPEKQDSLILLSKDVIKVGKAEKNPFIEANGYRFLARSSDDFKDIITNFEKALVLIKKHKIHNINKTDILFNLANFCKWNGDYTKAITYYFDLLALPEFKSDIELESDVNYNLAEIYLTLKDTLSSINKLNCIIQKETQIGIKLSGSTHYNSPQELLGEIYLSKKDYDKSRNLFIRALEKAEFSIEKANAYLNLSKLKVAQKEMDSAFYFIVKSEDAYNELENKKQFLIVDIKLQHALCYFIIKNYSKSIEYAKVAYNYSYELGYIEKQKDVNYLLYEIYSKQSDFKKSILYFKKFVSLKDSLVNGEVQKQLARQEYKSEYEKQKVIDDAENEKLVAIEKEAKAKQKVITYATAGGLGLVAIFLIFVFNRLQVTNKQKHIITQQKHLVEEKHKEITDSINYAERIQRSFLATTEILDQHLKDYFVFFRPKDVVSGDFYWAGELNNGNFAFSVADSTGHGVPGAIMSILNISSLEKSIEKETEPDQILNKTRKIIIERLKKDGSTEGGKDGMDCSLLVINKDRTQLSFASANNPVFIVNPNRTECPVNSLPFGEGRGGAEFKPDKMPVGKHDNDTASFTLHSATLQKGDVIYALTDGFPDQFGGDKGKKYMIKNLKELLLQIAHLPMPEQEQKLAEEFDKWKGSNEQVDDVCIIGVRV